MSGTMWISWAACLLLAGQSGDRLVLQNAQVSLVAQVRVPAQEPGVLAELHVKEGDLVEKDQVLAVQQQDLAKIDEQLARIDYEIARLQSENDVDRRFAKKSLEVAEAELARLREAIETYPKSVSQTELERQDLVVQRSVLAIEQAERDLAVAELTKQLKEQTLRTAQTRLEHRTIRAPLAGMVVELMKQPGEWLNPGDELLRIIKLDRLRVEALVDGRRYGAELLGKPVTLEVELPPGGRTGRFVGTVVFVSPELNPVSNEARIWAEVDNVDYQLRPGALGTLTIWLEGGPGN